jgi:hypothetical protein
MPDPRPEWNPSEMISLKDESLKQVTAEFHEPYERKSRKTSYAVDCLDQATDSVLRTKFQNDPRMTNVSMVVSRIADNDVITEDQLHHGEGLYGAEYYIWGLDFTKDGESHLQLPQNRV